MTVEVEVLHLPHTFLEYLAGRTDHQRRYQRTLTPKEETPSLEEAGITAEGWNKV